MSVDLKTIRDRLRIENRESLRDLVEQLRKRFSLGEDWSQMSEDIVKIAQRPVYDLTYSEICDLGAAMTKDNDIIAQVAPSILRLEEQLCATIDGNAPIEIHNKEEWAYRVTIYVATVFVPAASHLNRFGLAVNACARLISRILGREFDFVPRAGAKGTSPPPPKGMSLSHAENTLFHRYILLMPVYGCLAAYFPEH